MKKVLVLLVLALASVAVVACGDDDDGTATTTTTQSQATKGAAAGGGGDKGGAGGGSAAGSTLAIEADPGGGLSFTADSASTKAGNVTIDFKNPQPIEHDVDVEGSGGEEVGGTEVISDSSTSVTLQNLKPGEYTFYCSVPGHREAGMEGTLTVK